MSLYTLLRPAWILKQKSEYGADAVCGCAYDEEKHLLIIAKIDRGDSRNSRIIKHVPLRYGIFFD
mgnify:CR=1 FL=1